MANWHIGEYIVEYEQGGKAKAEYGKQLLVNLSKDLTLRNGKGFSRSNLTYMRKFYLAFPKCETVSHKLIWSHYFELLKCDAARDWLTRTWEGEDDILHIMLLKIEHMFWNLKKHGMQVDFYIDSYNFMESDFSFSFEVDFADGKSILTFCKTLQKELEEHSVPIKNGRQ